MNLDFTTSNEDLCKQYGIYVKTGELNGSCMTGPLEEIKNKNNFSFEEAVIVIKNITLAAYYVPIERTDFQFVYSKALLHAASFIDGNGSLNFKILYALFKSQVEIDETSFKKTARSEIIGNMLGRFNSLVNEDIIEAEHMKSVFTSLLKKDARFSIYSY
ncbi:hypothetical protein BCR32DRAFT_327684 [Anaeromyces robustus]|uniref:Uncharacterized protein n=1 Tax=Anaeromyces robustus TaxID=1754192 RepID=A0A1Y1X3Y8_9FUNG|nr:hypothetical protein BCR32DRAFT_327684 [Anaeromyces robustus]|eukprot:ORX80527.1 hypothetical protein BCR32DRAFT_327684 [Anaeromyces robustus]